MKKIDKIVIPKDSGITKEDLSSIPGSIYGYRPVRLGPEHGWHFETSEQRQARKFKESLDAKVEDLLEEKE